MPLSRDRFTRLALGACLAASLPGGAGAQSGNDRVLEEIVVTAQRREESLQEVPISVVALDAQRMQDANMSDLADVAEFTPNLSVYSHPPFTSLRVRGLGSPFDKGFEHSAGLFLDGVYVGRLAFLDAAFLDVASVEILRGPQGTLFGKNTISGAISIRSVQPGPHFDLSGSAAVGDEGLRKLSLAGNLPLGDTLALRLAVLDEQREGPVFNTTLKRDEGGKDARAGRLQLRWDALDWLNLTLSASRTDQLFTLGSFQIQTATDEQFALMQAYDPEVEMDPSDERSSQNFPAETTQDGGKYDLRLNADLWSHDVTLTTAFSEIEEVSRTDLDFSPIPLLFFLNGEDYEQISQEIKIVSPFGLAGGRLDYVVGAYVAESSTAIQVIIDAAPEPFELLSEAALLSGLPDVLPGGSTESEPGERLLINGFQDGRSLAVYGQATWHATASLSLTGGLRLSREEKTVDQVLELFTAGTDADGPIFTQLVTAEEYQLIDRRRDDDISAKLALRWMPDEAWTSYVSIAEGFKGGGYSGSAVRAEIAEVEPETSITYEAGFKARLLGGQATANLAVFRTEFEDLQLTIFEGNVSRISNAAGAVSQGVELDTAFLAGRGFSGHWSVAYLDARFTDYANGPCPAGEDTPCDLTGGRLSFAPYWKSSFSLNYEYALPRLPWTLLAGFDVLFTDDQLLQPDQDPIDRQSAYTTFNARLRLGSESGWSVQALLRNLSDKHALDSSSDIPTLSGAHFGRAIAPRQLDLSLNYRF